MNDFLEAIEKNEDLKAKVEELNKGADTTTADFIALAKEYGFVLTESEFTPCKETDGEISDDELQAVAGGGNCACVGGGGGKAGSTSEACACVAVGFGLVNENEMRCVCTIGGAGSDK